jgi:hypothetical protein
MLLSGHLAAHHDMKHQRPILANSSMRATDAARALSIAALLFGDLLLLRPQRRGMPG